MKRSVGLKGTRHGIHERPVTSCRRQTCRELMRGHWTRDFVDPYPLSCGPRIALLRWRTGVMFLTSMIAGVTFGLRVHPEVVPSTKESPRVGI
jgi:hypothetical protein